MRLHCVHSLTRTHTRGTRTSSRSVMRPEARRRPDVPPAFPDASSFGFKYSSTCVSSRIKRCRLTAMSAISILMMPTPPAHAVRVAWKGKERANSSGAARSAPDFIIHPGKVDSPFLLARAAAAQAPGPAP